MGKDEELSIIIYSCWKNKDMWEIFSILFRKYWESCVYKVILVTDEYYNEGKSNVFDDIVVLDGTWAEMIKAAIEKAGTKYVMLWMDDYLLCDYVNNDDIQKQMERAKKYNAANLRLVESPKCSGHYKNQKNIGYYDLGEPYSLATQVGIWDTAFLREIIVDKWSAWDFERQGSMLHRKIKQPLLTALDYVFPYEEGVRKGKWMTAGEKLCRRNGIRIDTSKRPIMSNFDMAKIYFQGALLDWCPAFILKVQNIIGSFKRR